MREVREIVTSAGSGPPETPQHVVVVDFSNHHFVKVGTAVAGSEAVRPTYLFSADFQSPNMRNASDNYGSEVVGVTLGEPFAKYSFVRRQRQERAWAKLCCEKLDSLEVDAVFAANCPVDVLTALHSWARRSDVRFGVWVQDLYGPMMEKLLRNPFGPVGSIIGKVYSHRERRVLRDADLVACIDESLQAYITTRVGRPSSLLRNWAALDDIDQHDYVNEWSVAHGVSRTRNIVYSGTLGMKHSPRMLVDLAEALQDDPDVRVVVVSEGLGADVLAAAAADRCLSNLKLLPFQAPEDLAQILGSSRVCLMLLNESASDFCIPSKLLSYLCAGRPVVGAIPAGNPAAALIDSLDVGQVVGPSESEEFIAAVRRFLAKPDAEQVLMGKMARNYAEEHFALPIVADQMGSVLRSLVK